MTKSAISFHNEEHNGLAPRVLKFAFVVGVHGALVALALHMSRVMPSEFMPIRIDMRPIEVSLLPAPQPSLTSQAPPVSNPYLQPPKPIPKTVPHVAPRPEPVIARPTLAAIPNVTPASTPSPIPVKESASTASIAPNATPLIAAHVDADYLQKPVPTYPVMSRRLHEEGKVQLLVRVATNGAVESIHIKQGSGFARLDEVALNTVRQWRFVPARRGEQAVVDNVVVPIVFKLDD